MLSSGQRLTSKYSVALLCCGCSSQISSETNQERLEPVLRAVVTSESVRVTVPTRGCTTAKNFAVVVRNGPKNIYELSLRRTVPDPCKGFFPEGTDVTFKLDELGVPQGSNVILKNDVQDTVR